MRASVQCRTQASESWGGRGGGGIDESNQQLPPAPQAHGCQRCICARTAFLLDSKPLEHQLTQHFRGGRTGTSGTDAALYLRNRQPNRSLLGLQEQLSSSHTSTPQCPHAATRMKVGGAAETNQRIPPAQAENQAFTGLSAWAGAHLRCTFKPRHVAVVFSRAWRASINHRRRPCTAKGPRNACATGPQGFNGGAGTRCKQRSGHPKSPSAISPDIMESKLARLSFFSHEGDMVQSGKIRKNMLCMRNCNDTQCWGQEHKPAHTLCMWKTRKESWG